jgi:hypothetical protein
LTRRRRIHSYGARLSLHKDNSVSQALSVGRDRIVFKHSEITGWGIASRVQD